MKNLIIKERIKYITLNKKNIWKGRIKMKKYKLKNWVKVTLFSIATAIAMISLMTVNSNLEKEFINNCESKGYTTNYCIAHK